MRTRAPGAVLLRLLGSLLALGCGAAALVVVALLLHTTFASAGSAAPAAPAARASAPATRPAPRAPRGFPAPPAGAVVWSREAGDDALALGIVPHGSRALVQVSIVNGQGAGAKGRHVTVGVDGRAARAAPCGPGCYRATLTTGAHPRTATVSEAATTWHVALPATWPPPSAAALMQAATATFEGLSSLAFHDHLASDPIHAVSSSWRVAAPNRAAYVIPGGAASVIIAGKRWDRTTPQARWVESPQTVEIHQPLPFWTSVTDAHVLRRTTFHGHAVDVVSFFDPGTPAWFQVMVEPGTHHTLDMHMTTTAHFMHETYYDFDSAPPIVPPR